MNKNINNNEIEFLKSILNIIEDFRSGKLKRRQTIARKIAGLGMSFGYVGANTQPYSEITETALDLEVPKYAYNDKSESKDYDKDWDKFIELIEKHAK